MLERISGKTQLIGGAAVLVLIGAAIGGGGAYLLNRPAASPAEQAEHGDEAGHAEEDGAAEGLVSLTPAQARAAGLVIVGVGRGGGAETRLSGRVEPMVDARAAVAASVGGRVARVLVAPGQTVRTGQSLVRIVSGDAASLRADADATQAAFVAAEQAHGRDEELADQGVISRREAEVSHAEALSAQAAARAARARLGAAGAPDAAGQFSVVSPISGVVNSVLVGPGGFVPQGGVVAEVTNPARVELVFNAPPQLAAEARPGSRIRVSGATGEFDAVVTGVAANAGGQNSGATVIRARADATVLPPAGSPVTGAVVTNAQAGALSVPSEAVQTVDGASVVFVQVDGGFRPVQVMTGRQASGRTEILRGLTGDARVVGQNAFLLKAELAKGEAEHGH